jgi:hypothetical protein
MPRLLNNVLLAQKDFSATRRSIADTTENKKITRKQVAILHSRGRFVENIIIEVRIKLKSSCSLIIGLTDRRRLDLELPSTLYRTAPLRSVLERATYSLRDRYVYTCEERA